MQQHDRPSVRPTQPPGSADAAALEYARRLVRDGKERTADFWACVSRRASELGVK